MFLHGFTIIYFTIGCTTKDYKHSQTLYLKNWWCFKKYAEKNNMAFDKIEV